MNHLNLKAMLAIREYFEFNLEGFSVKVVDCNELERIYILEDSLVILVQFAIDEFPVCTNAMDFYSDYIEHPYLEFPTRTGKYYDFIVEELTPNEIGFKFNRTAFVNAVEEQFNVSSGIGLDIFYNKFKGYQRLYWCPEDETTVERLDRQYPHLKLKDRYNAWSGEQYNYIVYEAEDVVGEKYYAVSYTKSSPVTYVNKMGKEYIRTGRFSNDNTRRDNNWDFDNALHSWRGFTRQKQIEEHLDYFVIQKYQKEFDDVWKYADHLLLMAKNGSFSNAERFSYVRPTNKWISEELVYKLAKKMFKQYKVIYQHRPFFLKSSFGGQMSYDVYISGINVAIEYQGKQHFEPIEFFGGESGFQRLKKRDAEKFELSKMHGVKLIYINYWEEVNEKLIRTRIADVLDVD